MVRRMVMKLRETLGSDGKEGGEKTRKSKKSKRKVMQ